MTNTDTFGRLPDVLPVDPMRWAEAWLKDAIAAGLQDNPNAMTIATVGADHQPSARVVLCKEFVPDPGYVVFYTNYESRKAEELARNSKAAALFHWDAFGRQIRIEGIVSRSPTAESDEYFASRGWGSQLGAWGSDQSRAIDSREQLVAQIRQRGAKLGLSLADSTEELDNDEIPVISRPPYWGGFRLWAHAIELWISGSDRIHDRARWTRNLARDRADEVTATQWIGTRLQP
jgi:pyridoxamine 5'-phosphate oxidase